MLIYLMDDGYLQNPDYPTFSESIPFGGIVCKILNKYYGNPELPKYLKSLNKQTKKRMEALNRAAVTARSFSVFLRPWVSKLQEIVTDRQQYVERLKTNPPSDNLFPKSITVEHFWDNERCAVGEKLYVGDHEDLLVYDIGKTLERNIPIHQCYCGRYFIPSRKSEKYCLEHRADGAKKTRLENLKNNRCAALHKKIYDRLVRNADYYNQNNDKTRRLNEYEDAHTEIKSRYKSGEITEVQYYDWLCDADLHYRIRAKK